MNDTEGVEPQSNTTLTLITPNNGEPWTEADAATVGRQERHAKITAGSSMASLWLYTVRIDRAELVDHGRRIQVHTTVLRQREGLVDRPMTAGIGFRRTPDGYIEILHAWPSSGEPEEHTSTRVVPFLFGDVPMEAHVVGKLDPADRGPTVDIFEEGGHIHAARFGLADDDDPSDEAITRVATAVLLDVLDDDDDDDPRLYTATLHIVTSGADAAVELLAEVDDVLASHFGSRIHAVRESLGVSIHGSPCIDPPHDEDEDVDQDEDEPAGAPE